MTVFSENLKSYSGLMLRLGLGVIFTYHGFGMVFGEGAGLGAAWNPHGMPAVLQLLVAWGQFLGGLAFFLGFLTFYASIGIIIIMAGAIIMVHGKNGFSIMNQGFEYNYAIIMMCLALIASGPGPFSYKLK